ncbi:CvpA family protein [Paenibacillus sp. 1001270B_150601_E10]|uniref:CvpA family protein n=1 Tax=Paenibacillus sp. 1001270B_150601_E10 TaxID=2787079 RepID=UPI00189FBCE7|nr:CvpA family protein [Paenibacillus sp. 1001270B_150601_E10]
MQGIEKWWQSASHHLAAFWGQWNALDWLILFLCLCCIMIGAWKGLRSQALSLFGLIFAFIVAAKSYEYLIPWVKKRLFTNESSGAVITDLRIEHSAWNELIHAIVAFSLIFGFVWSGLWLIRFALRKLSSVKPIRAFDRLCGGILGAVHFIWIWGLIYVLMMAWPSEALQHWTSASIWMRLTGEWAPVLLAEAVQWAQWL